MIANLWVSAATFRTCVPEKVSFVLLNQLDLILTIAAINAGLYELNPLMRHLVAIPPLLITIKLVIPVLIAWLAPGKLLLPAIILLIFVISWNIKELLPFAL